MGPSEPTQRDAPYLEAIRAHAARDPARLYIPGHKGGAAADADLLDTLGLAALRHDIPALTWGIDIGPTPTAFEHAQRL
ncbi:MAG TPA: amino acid decarboxylase, partial [Solirubrobacteraceae bacterium]